MKIVLAYILITILISALFGRGVLFKTYPRILNSAMMLSGTVFMGSFAFLLYPSLLMMIKTASFEQMGIVILITFSFFFSISAICLYHFLSTKTLWLTQHTCIIKYFFLPYKRSFKFEEIKCITQSQKKGFGYPTGTFHKTYLYTEHLTTMELTNGKRFKTYSILPNDYDILTKNIRKLKNGQPIKNKKGRTIFYLLENIDGIFWLVITLTLTIRLSYHIFKK